MSNEFTPHPASYRDPAGFIFYHNDVLYRQVNQSFRNEYELFTSSGACDEFVQKGWLVPHQRIDTNYTGNPDWYCTLKPETIPFISYPWEWSFTMLKDAALLTLTLAQRAIRYGMTLKDATPLNVQFMDGRLVFIDTLSFGIYDPAKPWVAYRQFCETFLSPLLLMHYSKLALQPMLLAWPDGMPLAVTRKLLPWRSRFRLPIYLHIYLHAALSENRKVNKRGPSPSFSKQKMLNLLANLETLVKSLRPDESQSQWVNYYDEAGNRDNYLEEKKRMIAEWLALLPDVSTVADLGANEAEFSMLAISAGKEVIASDLDPYCIDRIYNRIRNENIKNLQPLVLDLSQPSPAAGVDNREYASFSSRCEVHLVMALALIHHLCIGKNISASQVARFFSGLGEWLLLEFVPAEDEKARVLLSHKERTYPKYNEQQVLADFLIYYDLLKQASIGSSGRSLWLLRKKQP